MSRYFVLIIFVFVISFISCGSGRQDDNTLVRIETDYGDITLKLYDDTPLHKENFIKLVQEGVYDGLLFHRVVQNFMIQGGDPTSKDAEPGTRLGGGSIGYTIPAEFMPEIHFHKRGALAAARTGGPSNPNKESSGIQFYIVQGEVYSQGLLDTMEMARNSQLKNEILRDYVVNVQDELQAYRDSNDVDGFNMRVVEIQEEVDSIFENSGKKFAFSDEKREIYTTIGGYPSLDGEYTVFGEVVEGMDVVDKIAALETDQFDRPLEDVKMKMELVE